MSDYIPHQFEQFPDEILLEIFDYLHLNDLIRAFYNLNHRFNSILFSSNIHLRILYPDDIENNNLNQKIFADLILNQRFISRLRLDRNKNIPDGEFINLSHIRSLILETPTLTHIEQITSTNFPQLEYLRIGQIKASNQLTRLHHDIFSNGFSFLRKCSLNHITDNQLWTGSPLIRSLGIGSNNPHLIVKQILPVLINLVYLHLFLTWDDKIGILDEKILRQHLKLKYLKLNLKGQWTLDKLDSLLAYTPTVINLGLYSSFYDPIMRDFQWNFSKLSYLFLCRLPNLFQFDCEFIFKKLKSFDFNQISSLHSCFNRIQYGTYPDDDLYIRIFTK
jgi:hypothetical protein